MDPQQRVLLEVAWSAFEDAGIPPSSLSGQSVGVYVGASQVDYQNSASNDPAAVMESHYMTGNSLSVLANRISYVFDFHGPSFTVDSACSSSLVALNEAMSALKDGRIDLALVAGQSASFTRAVHWLQPSAHAVADRPFAAILAVRGWLCCGRRWRSSSCCAASKTLARGASVFAVS